MEDRLHSIWLIYIWYFNCNSTGNGCNGISYWRHYTISENKIYFIVLIFIALEQPSKRWAKKTQIFFAFFCDNASRQLTMLCTKFYISFGQHDNKKNVLVFHLVSSTFWVFNYEMISLSFFHYSFVYGCWMCWTHQR